MLIKSDFQSIKSSYAFNYEREVGLTSIVAGHYSSEALAVEEFEKVNGAVELQEDDIRHKIIVIKINKLYRRNILEQELYNCVRGIWRAALQRVKIVDYVFGVYNSLIVAVYKPTEWFICKGVKDKLPRQDIELDSKKENRLFFVDEGFENHESKDEAEEFYLYKSIAGLKMNQSAQNPITYLGPKESE